MSDHHHEDEAEGKFSVPFFTIVIVSSLLLGYASVAFLAPNVFWNELQVGWASLAVAFILVHLANSFVEFIFHRYVLHAPFVPFLAYFYRQHTLHHSRTYVRRARSDGTAQNRFPILEEAQHEASFFPAYSFIVFAGLATPLFVIVHLVWPSVPVFIPGYAALAWSLTLYEFLHALEHKPIEQWIPFLEHPKFGMFCKLAYGFHLRHHADIGSNESISGFFGFPIPDLVFGTWVNPRTLYEDGKPVEPKEFAAPRPRFIGPLDHYVEQTIRKRRLREARS